jgi:hypothetical protein
MQQRQLQLLSTLQHKEQQKMRQVWQLRSQQAA